MINNFWLGWIMAANFIGLYEDIVGRDYLYNHWADSAITGPIEGLLILLCFGALLINRIKK